jgi:magnesium-transporting ATPase (P-type)
LALKGADYLDLVRGVVCHKCKKSICNCLENDYVPTLKNMDEFQRIIRYLRVLGEADYYSKYALMVGLLKNNHEVCVIGKDQEDIPAMAISTLSICSAESKLDQVAHVIMPNYSLKCVYSLVLWSRFSYDFVSKFVQLVLTNLLVGAILIFGCGIVAEQYLFKLLQILWLQMVINPLLAINLALEKPSDSLRERR